MSSSGSPTTASPRPLVLPVDIEAQSKAADQFAQGAKCYFEHPQESWVAGTVRNMQRQQGRRGEEVSFFCAADSGAFQQLSASSVDAKLTYHHLHVIVDGDRAAQRAAGADSIGSPISGGDDEVPTCDDLLDLPYLHDSTLLQQVRQRYFNSVIYTRIGPIVLALNPFDYNLPNYVDARMPTYIEQRDKVLSEKSQLLPHAWSVAHEAYWLLQRFSKDQSIIVSGESGAGKTETAKIVVKYLGRVSTQQCAEESRAAAVQCNQRVIATSPILEAFGNAKTVRNDNSSRFGKFMKVQFDAAGVMIGSRIEVYLLEKSRVIIHGTGERAYHSFYQLVAGAPLAVRARLHLANATQYPSMAVGKSIAIPGVDDAADFREVGEAMGIVGLNDEEQSAAWETVAGILALLQTKFNTDPADDGAAVVADRGPVETAAELWGVPADRLVEELTKTSRAVAGERVLRRLKPEQAVDVRDALCKALYERLFLFLVQAINALIDRSANNPADVAQWLGLLDIFGFESFETNSFEQLCINLANETLQGHYNEYIFTRDMEECRAEGIDTATIQFYDNQPCLDMIGSTRTSLLSLLDEECSLGTGTDASFGAKAVDAFGTHDNFNKLRPADKGAKFAVRHYAGDVTYVVRGFREKNSDTLKNELKLVLRASKSTLIAGLLPEPVDRRGRAPTVGGVFRNQLNELMTTIRSTHPHWIRCVKPHPAKKPRMFHGHEVMTQLRCAGVLETVRIRKMSFSMRFPFDDFWRHARIILDSRLPEGGARAAAKDIFAILGLGSAMAQVGKTKVFMKTEGYHTVANEVRRRQARHATAITSVLRARRSCRMRHARYVNWTAAAVAAQLRGRESHVNMRELELKATEKMLIDKFRSLLELQGAEDGGRTDILDDAAEAYGVIGRQWAVAVAGYHREQRDALAAAELAARQDLFTAFASAADSLAEFAGVQSAEENARDELVMEQAAAWFQIIEDAADSVDAAVAAAALRAARETAEALVATEEAEIAARRVLLTDEAAGRRGMTRTSSLQIEEAVTAARLFAEEDSAFAALAAREVERYAAVVADWWERKATSDAAALAVAEKEERHARRLLAADEQQGLMALLMAAGAAERDARAAETERAELEAALRQQERRRAAAERARERREEEEAQRQLAQLAWRKAAREEARRKAAGEAREAALRENAERMAAPARYFDALRTSHATATGGSGGARRGTAHAAHSAVSRAAQAPKMALHGSPSGRGDGITSLTVSASACGRSASLGAASYSPLRSGSPKGGAGGAAGFRGPSSSHRAGASAKKRDPWSSDDDGEAVPESSGSPTRGAAAVEPSKVGMHACSASMMSRLKRLARPGPGAQIARPKDPRLPGWRPPAPGATYLPDGSVARLPMATQYSGFRGAAAEAARRGARRSVSPVGVIETPALSFHGSPARGGAADEDPANCSL